MIKYYVRTTGERKLDISLGQINYEVYVDTEHKPVKAFIDLLRKVQNEDVVLLEDDIILCNNFKEKIEDTIKTIPDEIINFFSISYYNKHLVYLNYGMFCYNQCTYLPSCKIKQIIKLIDNDKECVNSCKTPEKLCKYVFQKLNMKHYLYQPCLVQHLDNGSLLGHNRDFSRRSPYFIDYLEELNMTYEEAIKYENRLKLISLMKEKFKVIDK